MTRVTWLATGLNLHVTGIERFALSLFDELTRDEILTPKEVTVIADPASQWVSALEDRGAAVVRARAGKWRAPRNLPPAEIIHSLGRSILPRGGGGAKLFSVYDWGPVPDRTLPLKTRLSWTQAIVRGVRNADVVHFLNPELPAQRPSLVPSPRNAFVAYPSTTSGSLGERASLADDQGYALFVGTASVRKRLDLICQMATKTGQRVHLVGAGTDEMASDTVIGRGRISDHDLDLEYAGASALILVSSYEGFGIPILEAAARGIFSVVSPEVLQNLPSGIQDFCVAVDPSDADAFAQAIDSAASNRGRHRYAEDLLAPLKQQYASLLHRGPK